MAGKEERMFLHCPNIVALCLDSYEAARQKGRLYHQYVDCPIRFDSLIAAVCRMDAFYNEICFPYADTETRSFWADRKGWKHAVRRCGKAQESSEHEQERKDRTLMATFDQVTEQRGNDATFIIRVSHRQHSSWQGEVTWVDGRKKEYFRSALELVKLIDGVLETEKLSTEKS